LYTLSAGKVALLEIPLPPVEEQRRVVAVLNEKMVEAERVRKGAGDQIAAINALPAALLRRAFAGEL
jgi:type I restriction enzyme, S subunit